MTAPALSSGWEISTPRRFTVQCGCVTWLTHTVTVEAGSIEDACRTAIEEASQSSAWRPADGCGPTYVDVLAEGEDVDPWRPPGPPLPVPPAFAEDAEAQILRAVILGLLDWAAATGGWDAPARRAAERAVGRREPDDGPKE